MTHAELNTGSQLFLPTLGQGHDAPVPALLQHEQLCCRGGGWGWWVVGVGGCRQSPTTSQRMACFIRHLDQALTLGQVQKTEDVFGV